MNYRAYKWKLASGGIGFTDADLSDLNIHHQIRRKEWSRVNAFGTAELGAQAEFIGECVVGPDGKEVTA